MTLLEVDSGTAVVACGDGFLGGPPSGPVDWEAIFGVPPSRTLLIFNFEATLAEACPRPGISACLVADLRAIEELAAFRHVVVSLANNHVHDTGEEGIIHTADRLKSLGIHPIGFQENLDVEPATLVVDRGGHLISLHAACEARAFVGGAPAGPSTPGVSILNSEMLRRAVTRARAEGHSVWLVAHWGREYRHLPDQSQETHAAELERLGVEVVLGSHPHTTQPIVWQGPHPVAYSLGDFIFPRPRLLEGFELRVDPLVRLGQALISNRAGTWEPRWFVVRADGWPRPLTPSERFAIGVLERLPRGPHMQRIDSLMARVRRIPFMDPKEWRHRIRYGGRLRTRGD